MRKTMESMYTGVRSFFLLMLAMTVLSGTAAAQVTNLAVTLTSDVAGDSANYTFNFDVTNALAAGAGQTIDLVFPTGNNYDLGAGGDNIVTGDVATFVSTGAINHAGNFNVTIEQVGGEDVIIRITTTAGFVGIGAGENVQIVVNGISNPETADDYVISVLTSGNAGDSDTITIVPDDPDSTSVTVQPANTVAGVVIGGPPTVTVVDQFNNPVPAGTNVTVTVPGGFDAGTTTVPTDANGIAEFSDLVIETAATGLILTFDTDFAGVADVDSDPFDITHAALASFEIGQIADPQVAGVSFIIDVTAVDAFGNTVLSFDGVGNTVDVSLNQNDPPAVGGGTTADFVDGVLAHTVQINDADTGYEIDVEDTASGAFTGTSNTFDVDPAAPATASVVIQPATTVAGATIVGPPTVLVEDGFNNPVPGISVEVEEQGGYVFDAGTLVQVTDANGEAGFNDLVINTADTGYVLVFDTIAVGVADVNSDPFNVIPGPPATVAVVDVPGIQIAGDPFNMQSLITNLEDAFNNAVADAVYDVTITSNIDPVQIRFATGVQFTNGDAAGPVFITLEAAGVHSVTVEVDVAAAVIIAATVAPATETNVVLANIPGLQTAGDAFDISGDISGLEDQFNNTAADGVYNVTVESDLDGIVHVSSPINFTGGVPTDPVSITLVTAGVHDLDLTVGAAAAPTANATVVAATEASVVFANIPGNVPAGIPTDVSGQISDLVDAFGNTAADGNYLVAVTSDIDGPVSVPSNVAFLSGSPAGPIVISASIAGSHVLTVAVGAATDTANATVVPGPADQIELTGPPNVQANVVSDPFTITLLDQFGQVTTASANTTFTLSSSSVGTVSFSQNNPMVPAGSSSVNFTYSDDEIGNQTVTATRTAGDPLTIPSDSHNILVFGGPEIAVVSITPSAAINEGVTATVVVSATDVNGLDDLTGSASIGSLVLSASNISGATAGTATFSFFAGFDTGDAVADLTFTATNSLALSSQTVANVTVVDVPPTITATPSNITIAEADTEGIVVTATDGHEVVSIDPTVNGFPAGALVLVGSDPAGAVVSATYIFSPTYGDAGVGSIDFLATNSNGGTATDVVNATVTPAVWNLVVLTDGTGGGAASAGAATFSDGDAVIISATPAPGSSFGGWSLLGPGSIADVNDANTTFTGGLGDATVTATFDLIPAGNQLALSAAQPSVPVNVNNLITVELQDQFNNPIAAATDLEVFLTSSPVNSASFGPDAVTVGPVTSVTIVAGASQAAFTYANADAGTYVITGSDTVQSGSVTVQVAPVISLSPSPIPVLTEDPQIFVNLAAGDAFKAAANISLSDFNIVTGGTGLTAIGFQRISPSVVRIDFDGTASAGTLTIQSLTATQSNVDSNVASVNFVVEDRPTVISTVPASGAVGVSVNTPISANFDRAVSAVDLSGVTISPSVVLQSVSLVGNAIVIDPTAPLADDVMYTVTIPANAVEDATGFGNFAHSWSFETGTTPEITRVFLHHDPQRIEIEFNVPTNTPAGSVFDLFAFNSSPNATSNNRRISHDNANHSGSWNATGDVYTVSISNVGNRNFRPDDFVTVLAGANLRNEAETSAASTSTKQGEGGWVDPPGVVSVAADTNNTLTITFDGSTNRRTSSTTRDSVLTQSGIDELINWHGRRLGNSYNGVWSTDSRVLTITILDPAPANRVDNATLGIEFIKPDDPVTFRQSGRLRNSAETLGMSREVTETVLLTGGWVGAPGINNHDQTQNDRGIVAVNNTTLEARFNQPTNASPGLNVTIPKDQVDRIFNFGGKSLGTNYTGQWITDHVLRVTISDISGRNLIAGDSISIRGSANIRNAARTSHSSTASRGLTGGWIPGPSITSAIVDQNDTLTLTFNEATDRTGTISRDHLRNEMFSFETAGGSSRSLGDDYSGTWLSPTILRISITNPNNRDFMPGDIVRVRGQERRAIRNAARTSAPSLAERAVIGTWGPVRMTNARTDSDGAQVIINFSEAITIVGGPSAAQLASLFTASGVNFGSAVQTGSTQITLNVSGPVIPADRPNFQLTYTQNATEGWRIQATNSELFMASPSTVTVVNAARPGLAIRLPGQTWTEGVGITGTPSLQTAGIAFSAEVILTNNAGNQRLTNDVNNSITLSRRAGTGTAGSNVTHDGATLESGNSSVTVNNIRFAGPATDEFAEQLSVQLVAQSGGNAGLSQFTEGISTQFDVRASRLVVQLPGQSFSDALNRVPLTERLSANIPFGVTITLVNASNNPIDSDGNRTVTISLESGEGSLGGNLTGTLENERSSVAINGITYSQGDTGVVLRAETSANGIAGGRTGFSGSFNVGDIQLLLQLPGQQFVEGTGITGAPSLITVDSPFDVIVTLVDAEMNSLLTGAPTIIEMATAVGTGELTQDPLPVEMAFDATQVVFADVSYSAVEDGVVLQATGTAGAGMALGRTGMSSPFDVTGGTLLVQLPGQSFTPGVGITGDPSVQGAGAPFSVAVILVDAATQPLMNTASDTIELATEVGTGILSAATRTLSATQVVFTDVTYNIEEDGVVIKATGVSGNGLAAGLVGLSDAFDVTTGPFTQILVTGPSVVQVGIQSDPIVITALDSSGQVTTVEANTAFGLSSTSDGNVTFSPNAPVIMAGSSTTQFTYTDSAVGNKVITISGGGVPSVNFEVTVVETIEPEVSIVSVDADHGMGFVPVVGPVQEDVTVRVVAEARGTVGGVSPQIDVVEVVTSLLPSGVSASEFVTLVSEVISPATAAPLRTVTATIHVAEGFSASVFDGDLSVVVTATNAADRTASAAANLTFFAEGEVPEDTGIDEFILGQGPGGISQVQIRNIDPSNGPILGLQNTYRGLPQGFVNNVGGGSDRGVYLSTGDINGDGQVDVLHSFTPVTDDAPGVNNEFFPNLFYSRNGFTRAVNGPPFSIFPHDDDETPINYPHGELRTAIGNFLGADNPQIAIAQGTHSNGYVRLVMHNPDSPQGWSIVGQFLGLEDIEGLVPAYTNNADGGVTVAAGDLTGNGLDELIVGQTNSDTSTARIQVLSFSETLGEGIVVDENVIRFQGTTFGPNLMGNGGVNLAVGDMNGDGMNELIVASMGNSRDHGDGRDTALGNVVIIRKPVVTDGQVTGLTSAPGTLFNILTDDQNPSGALSIAAGEFDGDLDNGQELIVGTSAIFEYDAETLTNTAILPAETNLFYIFKANYNEDGTEVTSVTNVLQLVSDPASQGRSNRGRSPFQSFTDSEGNVVPMNPLSGAVNVAAGNTHRTDQ